MLDHIGPPSSAEGIGIPERPAQQRLDAVWGGFAIDCGELPAVFALYGAESTTDRRPSAPPDFTPGKWGGNPSLYLRLPQCPGTYRGEGHVFWQRVLLLPPLRDSLLLHG